MKISELPLTEKLNDEDIVPVVQNGENKVIKKEDLFKGIPTVDPALDENSINAIQNAVVAKEFRNVKKTVDENKKKWILLNFEEFSASVCKLSKTIIKSEVEDSELGKVYRLRLSFSMYPIKRDADGVAQPLTNIPFEVSNSDVSLTWLNSNEFMTFGVLIPQNPFPFNLLEEADKIVDGSVFLRADSSIDFSGYAVGFYEFDCNLYLFSYSEEATDILLAELETILNSATHFCLSYEKQNVVEAELIGE